MPIVVDPGFVPVPSLAPVVSPDGVLSVEVDRVNAGALLHAAFDPYRPEKVLRRNLVSNPSFETGTAGWSADSGVTLAPTTVFAGQMNGTVGSSIALLTVGSGYASPYAKLETHADNAMPVTPGGWVAVRFWAATESTGEQIRVQLRFGTPSEGYAYYAGSFAPAGFYTGKFFTFAARIPTGKTVVRVQSQLFSGSTTVNLAAGKRMWADQIIACTGSTQADVLAAVAAYFDGDTPDTPNLAYRFTAAPHASPSEEYIPAVPHAEPGRTEEILRTNYARNPGFSGASVGDIGTWDDSSTWFTTSQPATRVARFTYTGATATGNYYFVNLPAGLTPIRKGQRFTFGLTVKNAGTVAIKAFIRSAFNADESGDARTTPVTIAAGAQQRLTVTSTASPSDGSTVRVWAALFDPAAGSLVDVSEPQIEWGTVATPFFGDWFVDGPDLSYRWVPDNPYRIEEYRPARASTLPQKVRFERGDGTPVRSGNPAWAPGGYATAYDHEAPLGVGASWRAVPIYADGTEGQPTAGVSTLIPEPPRQTVWIKSTTDPNESMKIDPTEWFQPSYADRTSSTSIQGDRFPAMTWDMHASLTGTLKFKTRSKAETGRLATLLDSGPLLIQWNRIAGIEDFYFLPGAISKRIVTYTEQGPVFEFTIPVTECRRPATVDAPLRIPGLSWNTVAENYASWTELSTQVPSWRALLGVHR
ncbi:hypothetical protein LWF01_03005 [Saxibacter everestensis]|uniref:Minor tail protein n=1 Tax=Saxibacter everestensis TaxID=2909229 RepID=A0ABY8QUU3_9MICO|nr:hypothetical protein LWF01_03005 [Brevibacteriaceae bacterium ZFBP1038]